MLTALLVPVDGEPSIIEVPSGSEELKAIYSTLVCETIEAVSIDIGGEHFTAFIDEEGKYSGDDGKPKPTNTVLTGLALQSQSIMPTDWICGPALFVGHYDDEGETTSLTPDQLTRIQAALAGAAVAV